MVTSTTNVINALGATDVDTKTLTTNLVDAVRAPRQKLIDNTKKKVDVAISTTGLLKSAINALQTTATQLGSVENLNKLQITNSESGSIGVTPGGVGAAIPGNYTVSVTQVAKAQRTVSKIGFPSSSYQFGSDFTLNIGSPASPKAVEIKKDQTVTDLIYAINASDSGVTARLVNTGNSENPYKILLQGKPGEANNFTVTDTAVVSDGDSGLSTIFDIAASELTTQTAQNAIFELNGIRMIRSSNTVTDAIDGLTLQLSRATTSSAQIDVAYDATQVTDYVSNFVEAFNYVTDIIVRATGQPKVGDDISGTLQNNSTVRSIRNSLRSKLIGLSSTPGTVVTNWSDLGVSLDRNGVLQFDKAIFLRKYTSAPQDSIKAISNNASSPYLYSGAKSGLAGDVAIAAYRTLKSGGLLPSMETSNGEQSSKIDKQQSKLHDDISKLTAQYEKQFTAMNAVLANFKSTQQRLASMLNTNKNN